MPVDINDVVTLLSKLSDDAKLRVTVKESVKGGVICGVACAIGGVVGGPVGLAVGGSLGGCAAAYLAKGKFEPASKIILDMDEKRRLELYNSALTILEKLRFDDVLMLSALVYGDVMLQKQLLGVVVNHLQGNMKMTVLD
ncbi:protein C19orf12 homolog [Lineus longissimus]|uniref:protein C19orf12 homolog n=1 Tax=Lineus longissimus TaxID=88925 RepID=UPI002B4E314D